MLRRLSLLLAVALLAAPAAAADGPGPLAQQLGDGALSPNGEVRYTALPALTADTTVLVSTATRSGRVLMTAEIPGSWGIPTLNGAGPALGLSHDGRRLVLAEPSQAVPSKFVLYDPRTMRFAGGVVLKGSYTFDALSPDASRMYLIQHFSTQDLSRYVVRAYDLEHDRLLPGRIADRTQKGWVMQGYPVARTTSSDGRMAYTLYDNPGGYPFVHALDTVAGVAHCVGLPLSQKRVYESTLAVHGKYLSVGSAYVIDTTTWRLLRPHDSFPWWTLSFAALLPAALGVLLLYRRSRDLDAELAELLGERELAGVR
jgi:hypothetical protein